MRTSLVAAMVAAVIGFSGHTNAQAAARMPVAIPPQKLAPALRTLVSDRQFQIICSSEPAHRLAVYERNIDWFAFWLLGEEDGSAEKAQQFQRWRSMLAVSAGTSARAGSGASDPAETNDQPKAPTLP